MFHVCPMFPSPCFRLDPSPKLCKRDLEWRGGQPAGAINRGAAIARSATSRNAAIAPLPSGYLVISHTVPQSGPPPKKAVP